MNIFKKSTIIQGKSGIRFIRYDLAPQDQKGKADYENALISRFSKIRKSREGITKRGSVLRSGRSDIAPLHPQILSSTSTSQVEDLSAFPYCSIGEVFYVGGSDIYSGEDIGQLVALGTGFLINSSSGLQNTPLMVATAAHCVAPASSSGVTVQIDGLAIQLQYSASVYDTDEDYDNMLVFQSLYVPEPWVLYKDTDYDFAISTLISEPTDPLPLTIVNTPTFLSSDTQLICIGYPENPVDSDGNPDGEEVFNSGEMYQCNGSFDAITNRQISMYSNFWDGASGGPWFLENGMASGQVIGITSNIPYSSLSSSQPTVSSPLLANWTQDLIQVATQKDMLYVPLPNSKNNPVIVMYYHDESGSGQVICGSNG